MKRWLAAILGGNPDPKYPNAWAGNKPYNNNGPPPGSILGSSPMIPQYQSGTMGAGGYPNTQTGVPKSDWWTRNGGWVLPVATLVGTLAQSWIMRNSQRDANRTNIQLAREQRQWDLDMYNKMNEYNSPSAMAGRYADAGFSPWLAAEKGQGGNASSFPTGHAPSVDAEIKNLDLQGVLGMISYYQDFKLKNEEINSRKIGNQLASERINSEVYRQLNTRLSSEKLQKDVSWYDTRMKGVELSNQQKELNLDYLDGFLKSRNLLLEKSVKEKILKLSMMNLSKKELEAQIYYFLPLSKRNATISSMIAEEMLLLKHNQRYNYMFQDGNDDTANILDSLVESLIGRLGGRGFLINN